MIFLLTVTAPLIMVQRRLKWFKEPFSPNVRETAGILFIYRARIEQLQPPVLQRLFFVFPVCLSRPSCVQQLSTLVEIFPAFLLIFALSVWFSSLFMFLESSFLPIYISNNNPVP